MRCMMRKIQPYIPMDDEIMARFRTIKPEFWTSEQVMECSTNVRLLFLGTWNFCDDEGRHPWAPRQLKALIFPSDDFTVAEIEAMLNQLAKVDLIRKYTVEGRSYFYVTGWKHQKIDKRQPAKFPAPVEDRSETIPLPFDECSTNGQGTVDDGIQNTEVEKKEASLRSASVCSLRSHTVHTQDFEEFWEAYPKRDGSNPKALAKKKFKEAVRSGVKPQAIILAAEQLAAYHQSKNQIGSQYVPHAATWLNQRRWEDHANNSGFVNGKSDWLRAREQEIEEEERKASNAFK